MLITGRRNPIDNSIAHVTATKRYKSILFILVLYEVISLINAVLDYYYAANKPFILLNDTNPTFKFEVIIWLGYVDIL